MSDILQPPMVGDNGAISLEAGAGASLEISFVEDDGVTPRDVSARVYYFECGSLRLALTNGNTTDIKKLTLTRTQIQNLVGGVKKFTVLDETAGFEYSDIVWSNNLSVRT